MFGYVLINVGGFLLLIWGIAHLIPTAKVVGAFGQISPDNKRIITMEWIVEGVALIFLGALVCLVTYVDQSSTVSRAVYWAVFGCLNILSVISLFTGFRNASLPFKLCPIIFSGASILIIVGSRLQ